MATLALTKENPASDFRRIVVLGPGLRPLEIELLEKAFARKGRTTGASSQLKLVAVERNFWNKEQELVAEIENDQIAHHGNTAYAITSTGMSHSGAIVVALVCNKLGLPLVLFQDVNGQPDAVEVYHDGQRYVVSGSQVGTMSAGAQN